MTDYTQNIEITSDIKAPSQIVVNSDYNTWMMKFTPEGIFFNHEKYPQATPNDFAKAFIEIMEKSYAIKFIEKEKMTEEFIFTVDILT